MNLSHKDPNFPLHNPTSQTYIFSWVNILFFLGHQKKHVTQCPVVEFNTRRPYVISCIRRLFGQLCGQN